MIRTLFLLLALISTDPREIAKINSLKRNAAAAFTGGNYEQAVQTYHILDSLGVEDPALKLNLAHAFYQLNDTTGAKSNYQSVLNSPDKKLRSVAYQQLGVMDKDSKKYEEALQNLKSSIKADPSNEGARYDYELVKKLLEEQKKQEQEQQDQENKDQENEEENKDQENKEDQEKGDQDKEQEKQDGEKEESDEKQDGEKEEGENEEGEEQESEKEPTQEEMMQQKLEEMKISPEKAKMILEAMRNNEVQYLQQQRRKPTKRPPSGKPDW